MTRNKFELADTGKRKVSKETYREIKKLYEGVAKDFQTKLGLLALDNSTTGALRRVYLEDMIIELNRAIDGLKPKIKDSVKNAATSSADLVISAQNGIMEEAGLVLKGAYGYVPEKVVQNLMSGGLYKGDWSLSGSIWRQTKRLKKNVQTVVAQGIAANKPTKDIADDLVRFLKPSARKPWDWSKVYPGVTTQVDYNAQRLARTMIQHAYQQAMVESMKYNPYCHGVIWHSVFAHGRTCQLCKDRDGTTYTMSKLPLDHPNGLCYFEPDLDDMDKIAKSLARWANGGSNKALDTYVAKAFNYNPTGSQGKKVIQAAKTINVKEKTAITKEKFNPEKYIESIPKIETHIKENYQKGVLNSFNDTLKGLSETKLKWLNYGHDHLRDILRREDSDAWFEPMTKLIQMNFNKDLKGKQGKFSTFFHEYGHSIDDKLNIISANETFGRQFYEALNRDYSKLLADSGYLKTDVFYDLLDHEVTAGIQDIISGLSVNKNRVKWGHDTEYWERKGPDDMWKEVTSEAFANCNAAFYNPRIEKYFKKYFPEGYKLWKDKVKEIIKSLPNIR